ncbi:MAG: hypothetical protein GY785_14540 [Gammaproteobacteria bacterium]|nr:hypothetical protein [Gammaproteobacteria bacterium]
MKNYLYHSVLALLLPMLILAWGQAAARNQAFEFHADARMEHATLGPVENAYGYMYALTDKKGHGAVNVMFSNGNRRQVAQFNARVMFVDAYGRVLEDEYFTCPIAAAGHEGAVECKLTRAISLSGFDSIEVEFYLTDVMQAEVSASEVSARLQPLSVHSITVF